MSTDKPKPNAETPSKLIGLADKWESLETDCPALQPRVDAKHECAKELKAALAAETPTEGFDRMRQAFEFIVARCAGMVK